VDRLAPKVRSRLMARIKSRNNRTTEIRLRMLLVQSGTSGWRMDGRLLPGRPDFIFPRAALVVFVDGCFWHGCPRCYRRPSSNTAYWDAKVARNRARDTSTVLRLRRAGWSTLRIMEHELSEPERVIAKIRKSLKPKRAHSR